jgi:hypothetical protein
VYFSNLCHSEQQRTPISLKVHITPIELIMDKTFIYGLFENLIVSAAG